jgi:hypothetical protein
MDGRIGTLVKTLYGAILNFNGSRADRFKYPAGGAPKTTGAGPNAPIGAVISP